MSQHSVDYSSIILSHDTCLLNEVIIGHHPLGITHSCLGELEQILVIGSVSEIYLKSNYIIFTILFGTWNHRKMKNKFEIWSNVVSDFVFDLDGIIDILRVVDDGISAWELWLQLS